MLLSPSHVTAQPYQLTARQASRRPFVAVAAAAKKGFGSLKQQPKKTGVDGCPCGSGKTYKECCKPQHTFSASAPSVEDTVRARFSAILKKDVSYLLKTTSPFFHSFHYGGEPGASARQLEDDLWNTVEHYEYSNLRIREVRKAEDPNDATVVFQYTVFDKRTPLLDDQGNKVRKVQIEESRFMRDDERVWMFTDYKLVEVPEALAKTAELQANDMVAAAAAAGSSSTDTSSSQAAAA